MRKQFRIFSFLLLLVATSGYRSTAQTRYDLTVREAVELAYKNVIELKNAQLDYRIQESVNKETVGRALPQVSANLGTQYFLQLPLILFPNAADAGIYNVLVKEKLLPAGTVIPTPSLQAVSFQQPWNLAASASLQQLLFQPDVFVGLQARQTALDLSASLVEQTKERVKDSAYKRYYAILIAQKQSYFLNESIKRLEKLYHDDSVLYSNGFAEKLDLDRVQVQLINLRTTANLVETGVKLSYAALKFAIGLTQADTVVLKEELTNETIKEDVLDDSFKYEDRVEIQTLGYTRRLQELNVKRYRLGYLPTVALTGNYSINGLGQKFFTSKETRWLKSSYVGVNINLPIFDGFQRREKVRQAQFDVDKLDNNINLTKQGIDLQQVVTKESFKSALLNLDAQQRNMQLAETVYNTTKKKFEQGLGSSFEVLQADSDWQTAQANYFNALYNAIISRISYKTALGKLE
ncbi:TolC family protein [Segetibacter sp. 3557_3]|uniref:TolC family protein n=1 Tax=Segetibacter sp. 3557_3 TaxID=2547429 RepID=UPI001058FF5D|nr:TolC family protein [Segetibacter sp. 3557_3]TDH26183.1 TolC family protein [Segetibacter sp. 3557_3]